jgi:hypothetical protein
MREESCVCGEDAKRLLAYSPNAPRDTKLSLYWLIMVQHEVFLNPYFLEKMGIGIGLEALRTRIKEVDRQTEEKKYLLERHVMGMLKNST